MDDLRVRGLAPVRFPVQLRAQTVPQRALLIPIKPAISGFIPRFGLERGEIPGNVFAKHREALSQPLRVHQHYPGVHIHVIILHGFRGDGEIPAWSCLQFRHHVVEEHHVAVGVENARVPTASLDDIR